MGEEKYYIGCSQDADIRHRATSGGIGTAIVSYLLKSEEYGTAIAFYFDKSICGYRPKLIFDTKDLCITGSIYQDIDLVDYIKKNICDIKKGIVVTCLPCQVRAIRHLLTSKEIKCFIITFACSGQTLLEGTHRYYRLLGLRPSEIEDMQYRGNGWPSGIQIRKTDGTSFYKPNYTEPWKSLQASRLYRPKRCYFCTKDTDHTADISLADPWLERMKHEKEGKTLFSVNTILGREVISKLEQQRFISLEKASRLDWEVSQAPNIRKAEFVNNHRRSLRTLYQLSNNKRYRRIVSSSLLLLKLHVSMSRIFFKYFH